MEKYIDLENNPYLLGRITLHFVKEDYHAEVDIIHKESHKIFKHIDIVYGQPTSEEALIVGIQRLRKFLDKIENEAGQGEDDSDKPDILH